MSPVVVRAVPGRAPSRVPARRFYGETFTVRMDVLVRNRDDRNRDLDLQGWAGRRVMGYRLPDWQRPEVWTKSQCARFVESCYLGASIGTWMWNSCPDDPALDALLLDGQQRLRALERYIDGEIAVCGEDGAAWTWSALGDTERSALLRIGFPCTLTRFSDESLLREIYNRHNFSGTHHRVGADEAPDPGDLRAAVADAGSRRRP